MLTALCSFMEALKGEFTSGLVQLLEVAYILGSWPSSTCKVLLPLLNA